MTEKNTKLQTDVNSVLFTQEKNEKLLKKKKKKKKNIIKTNSM